MERNNDIKKLEFYEMMIEDTQKRMNKLLETRDFYSNRARQLKLKLDKYK